MSIIISGVNAPLGASDEEILSAAFKKAGIAYRDVRSAGIYKTSLDARKRNNIHLTVSVQAELPEALERILCEKRSDCSPAQSRGFSPSCGSEPLDGRVTVIGFGPAGMFAALALAEYGFRPLVLERGGDADSRVKAVTSFWNGGALDPHSNVQFGEGGAGTFSDGKLTTRIHDPLCGYVLDTFAEMGAPAEILTKAKPHIGTDNLRNIVKNIRSKIIRLGGEIRFDTQVDDISLSGGRLCGLSAAGETIPVGAAVLAIGHSARDTFSMLLSKGAFIEPKPFSCGARIEHSRQSVNESLYGSYAGDPLLPEGEYQLSHRMGTRAVYTFCMCPGGYVVPAQSEEDTVVVNGMSEFARNAENSNSALVVSVSPEDFGKAPLDGVRFAEEIERKAYKISGSFKAPAVSVGAFINKKTFLEGAGVSPSYALGVVPADFDKIFPPFVTSAMREGIGVFSRKMHCFGDMSAVLTAPETRTSSPVRITRGENMCAVGIDRLYPCGEGAGYAGGIMSAAADGLRCAKAIIERFTF